LFTDWTLDYLKKQKILKQPFFLFLTYNAPHDPVQPPQDWLKKVESREQTATPKRQKIIALIEHLDYNVGRILNYLKISSLDKNTIVVFTSDNGGALQYGASNYPFSGEKGDMLEGGIRVPCLVKLANHTQKMGNDTPLLLMDFSPTLIKLAGGTVEKELPSRPIPLVASSKIMAQDRNMIWMRREGHKYGGRCYYAISDGRYKLLQNNPFSPYQLFDLLEDPKETTPINLPAKELSLFKELTKHIQTSGAIPWQ
jgi:arylsulfatase A-like enzyme